MTTSPDAEPGASPASPDPSRTVRLVLTGDLDYDTCGNLLQQVQLALREHEDAEELRLDCAELGAVDSMGLSTLLQIHRAACRDGIGFHLDNIGPVLRRLLDLTGTYEHLHSTR
ncbi:MULTISPECIES: STAS domain-containing protein [unclassified Streptomyces]|uniref:STAS domain-containing protein n=1 Tax=unclassified Streptomyces TaxID=2593676 RepID=UPI001F328C7D|nr:MULTISPECIES: STAS domain-containing protein [unclassified Streptomyces]WKX17214.1 STAS domain-containing protein [Streptomyces sp. HUAS CX7]